MTTASQLTADTPTVTVVVPVRNAASTIAEQLAALAAQADDCDEIIVADNGSTDDTVEIVLGAAAAIPNLRLVDVSGRRGIGFARSQGAAAALGDRILFCDSDDVVAPGWITALSSALEFDPIVGGRVEERLLNGPAAVPRTDQWDALPTCLGFLPYAVGANFGVRADVVAALGGWDDAFSTGGEDVDFCWRAQLAGFTIGFEPAAVVHYRHRTSMAALRRQQYGYGRTSATLHRRFRSAGLPRGSAVRFFGSWFNVARRAPGALVWPERRELWHQRLGYAAGCAVGVVSERVWPY